MSIQYKCRWCHAISSNYTTALRCCIYGIPEERYAYFCPKCDKAYRSVEETFRCCHAPIEFDDAEGDQLQPNVLEGHSDRSHSDTDTQSNHDISHYPTASQAKINAAIKEVSRKHYCQVQYDRKDIDRNAYVNENNLISTFIYSKTRETFTTDTYDRKADTYDRKVGSLAYKMVSVCYSLFIYMSIFVFLYLMLYAFLEPKAYAVYLVATFLTTFGIKLVCIFHPRFEKKDLTREMIQELATLETLSETTRLYITELLKQLPTDCDPYFILKQIYTRSADIYAGNEKLQDGSSEH